MKGTSDGTNCHLCTAAKHGPQPPTSLLLPSLQATGEAFYRKNVEDFVREWMNTKSKTGDIFYTKKNLAKAYPYGTLQHTANAAFYTMVAAKTVINKRFMLYACWARNQIGYMLGDAGRSYVTGYGAVQPMKTPHKAASCPPPDVQDCTWESAYYTTGARRPPPLPGSAPCCCGAALCLWPTWLSNYEHCY